MSLSVLRFPFDASESVSDQLRTLAADIEKGAYGPAHSVSLVIDCGDGKVEVHFIGNSPLPGPTAHLMLSLGMRKLESIG